MHASAGRADARREALLERGLAVLVGELDLPLARARARRASAVSPSRMASQIRVRRAASAALQHLGVRDRGAHVVVHEALVERVVLAGRVREHTLVERRALVPEPAHVASTCRPAVRPATAR